MFKKTVRYHAGVLSVRNERERREVERKESSLMSGCHDEGREKLYVGGGDLGRPREGLRANCKVSEREARSESGFTWSMAKEEFK